jgi:hypothetical protein
MWDWLKDASKQFLETSAAYMQQRAFILTLFNMPQQQAYWVLKQKIDEMDDESIKNFSGALAGMIGEAQQATWQGGFGSSSSWGGSTEDRIAQGMAEIQAGFPSSQGNQQAQMYLEGLNAIAFYANQFYQEKLARAAQGRMGGHAQNHSNFGSNSPSPPTPAPAAPPTNQASGVTDTSQLESMIEKLVQSGKLDANLVKQLTSLNDEASIDQVIAKLKELGADEGGSPPLNIADYYQPRLKKYELKWPLSPALPLPVAFDQLDEPTQFSVLFAEWSRRELEANQALFSGDTAKARVIFEECLVRAEQLEVSELKARSFEGFMRVAQKLGDRKTERKWIDAAMAARTNG